MGITTSVVRKSWILVKLMMTLQAPQEYRGAQAPVHQLAVIVRKGTHFLFVEPWHHTTGHLEAKWR